MNLAEALAFLLFLSAVLAGLACVLWVEFSGRARSHQRTRSFVPYMMPNRLHVSHRAPVYVHQNSQSIRQRRRLRFRSLSGEHEY